MSILISYNSGACLQAHCKQI